MAYASWPATVPHECEAAAFTRRPYREMIATDMEGGNTRVRSRPGDNVEAVTWARRFTADQLAAWKAFLADTIARGTARFLMPIWTGAAYEVRVVQIVGGGGGVSEVVTGRGLYTRVSFSLLVLPAELVPVSP